MDTQNPSAPVPPTNPPPGTPPVPPASETPDKPADHQIPPVPPVPPPVSETPSVPPVPPPPAETPVAPSTSTMPETPSTTPPMTEHQGPSTTETPASETPTTSETPASGTDTMTGQNSLSSEVSETTKQTTENTAEEKSGDQTPGDPPTDPSDQPKKSVSKAVMLSVGLLIVGAFSAVLLVATMKPGDTQTSANTPTQAPSLPTSTPVVTAPETVDPNMTITSPQSDAVVTTESVVVSGKTFPRAEVFVNDTEIIADAVGNFTTSVDLEEGENSIVITANDQEGNIAEQEITVTYTPAE